MGSKKINQYQLVTAGSMTGTATITSNTQTVSNFDNLGLQVVWTGTPTGVFSVLGSVNGTQFEALTFDPALAQPAGGAGGYLINLNQFPWPYLQVQYVNSTGSGLLSVYIFSKDLN
jgi:hypothetical protein